MKIAVLGYGKQGMSAVNYWGKGNDITVCDKNTKLNLPTGVEHQTGDNYLTGLNQFNLIVRSPSIHPNDIVAANDERILRKVTSVTEEFFRVCPAPIIGVTGTKGKGTTSSLITKILETAGKKVHLGGNIGTPPLDMLEWNIQPSDWVVLELANFQLIDLGVSPKIAVCLMVVPEHLDWHTDIAEYIKAKQQLFIHQNPKDLAIFNRINDYSTEVVGVSPALKMSYEVPEDRQQLTEKNGAYVLGEDIYMDDDRVCSIHDVALLGRHNLQNVCAAIAATWDIIDNNAAVITKAVQEYKGLPHRLELVREVNGIKYFDDSFSTTPSSAAVAMEAVKGEKIMILGGSDKGIAFDELADAVIANKIKAVIQIGQMGPAIEATLRSRGYSSIHDGGSSMKTIIAQANNIARSGDSVILSPACASFDMFKDYIDRGEQFHQVVDSL
jgi:UDP-N-acetylmuramoylalanine--D-glutamate ligase